MASLPSFKSSPGTMGVELEWQLIDPTNSNLSNKSQELINRIDKIAHPGCIKPEITVGMIEFNSSVHESFNSLQNELKTIRDIVNREASNMNLALCGGGSHPFQRWQEQIIYPEEPFISDYKKFGYLAKQYTVFGLHIHVGCNNGDEAIYLCHALTRYLPQLIVLAASSPFYLGEDTQYDSTRLNSVSAFPLSGHLPWVLNWDDFNSYCDNLINLDIIENLSDFYWDVRPKPEFGTIEVRVCDCPLTVEKAAQLAVYTKLLVMFLLDKRPTLTSEIYLPYSLNRFHAARHGFEAVFIDVASRMRTPITTDIVNTCDNLVPYAEALDCRNILENIKHCAQIKYNDARWLREQYINKNSPAMLVNEQTKQWRSKS